MTGKHGDAGNGLPMWLNVTVVLGLLGLLGWNVVVVGPSAYPTSVMIGTLLGGYLALDRNIKMKRRSEQADNPPPPSTGADDGQ